MVEYESNPSIALEAIDVSKHFGGITALQNASVQIGKATCHAIVGSNGAGKSTLMKVLAGLHNPTSGAVYAHGSQLEPDPAAAKAAGIALVHQELSLCPDLSVAENIFLGDLPVRNGRVDRASMREEARKLCARLGVEINPDVSVGRLPTTLQQYVEIAKALRLNPSILILDEPTASLTPQEADKLIALLLSLRDQSVTIVYISHRIREIFSLCSKATVLRNGEIVSHTDLADSTPEALIEAMVGKKLPRTSQTASTDKEFGDVVLQVEDLVAPKVKGASLSVRQGEVLGIGGLMGSGRTELIRAILGLEHRTAGSVVLHGQGTKVDISSYRSAVRNKVAYVPEDRRTEGVTLNRTIRENVALQSLNKLGRFGYVSGKKLRILAAEIAHSVNLHPGNTSSYVKQLSGGNQQKVAFGRWLPTSPKLFILDEPTAGVDVGAKAEIHDLIKKLTAEGTSVIVVSSDLEELLVLSDRVVVIRDGYIAGELSSEEATEERIVDLGTREFTPQERVKAHA